MFQKLVHQAHIDNLVLNGFSKFLHWHTLWIICDKTIMKDFTTPKTCRCTTLWNKLSKIARTENWARM